MLWVGMQSTGVIALVVFSLGYGVAAVLFGIARILGRRPIATDLKATSPAMLAPLAIITALLIAFLASRVWSDFDHANASLAREASAIQEVVIYANTLRGVRICMTCRRISPVR